MSRPLERLEAEVLALSEKERAHLAHRLITSLAEHDEAFEDDPAALEAAWEEEIRYRLEEYRAGRMEAIPAEEVFAKARALLKR